MKGNSHNRFRKLQKSVRKLLRASDCERHRKPGIIERAIEELQAALGELQVIEEELRFQYDELLMARKDSADQRRRYRQLFDLIPDACLTTDTAGKIREVNRAAATALKVDRETLLGKLVADLVVGDQRKEFLDRLAQIGQLQRIEEWQLRLQPRGERPFDARVTVEVVRGADEAITGLHWIVRMTAPG